MDLEFTEFVRKPFVVEAIEITKENLEDIAKFVGTIRQREDGTPYIQVDRRLIPNVDRVFVGFWMTKMGGNIRCYSKRVFSGQFTEVKPEIREWVDFMNADADEEEVVEAT